MELFECCGRCRKCKNHCEDYEPEYYNSYVRDKYDWLIEKYGLEG